MTKLYLEDFAVGQCFTSPSRLVDAQAIKAFARDFDPQPFHLDEVLAQDSFFQGLAASGWHTASVTMSLLARSQMPIAGGLIGAGVEVQWPRPVRPGDTLTVKTTVLAVTPSRSKPDRGLITAHCVTTNQKGEVVQDMTCKIMAWARPPA